MACSPVQGSAITCSVAASNPITQRVRTWAEACLRTRCAQRTWRAAAPTSPTRCTAGDTAPRVRAFRCAGPRRSPRTRHPCSGDTGPGAWQAVQASHSCGRANHVGVRVQVNAWRSSGLNKNILYLSDDVIDKLSFYCVFNIKIKLIRTSDTAIFTSASNDNSGVLMTRSGNNFCHINNYKIHYINRPLR